MTKKLSDYIENKLLLTNNDLSKLRQFVAGVNQMAKLCHKMPLVKGNNAYNVASQVYAKIESWVYKSKNPINVVTTRAEAIEAEAIFRSVAPLLESNKYAQLYTGGCVSDMYWDSPYIFADGASHITTAMSIKVTTLDAPYNFNLALKDLIWSTHPSVDEIHHIGICLPRQGLIQTMYIRGMDLFTKQSSQNKIAEFWELTERDAYNKMTSYQIMMENIY